MNPFRPISISFSPNTQADDIRLAWKILFQPWQWGKGKEIQKIEEKFKKYLKVKYAFSFNSGRSALLAILKSLETEEGGEILLQAFTCSAAVNPILWQKLKPVFVDIDATLNLDPQKLERKITKKSKAVIIQHTFGCPAKIEEIKNICQKYNLFLIEDCAHSLGARHKGSLVGTFGDATFFSFGRDKVISSVYGGMAITNNKKIAQKLKEFQDSISFPLSSWVFQQILHPISFATFLPIYSFLNLGKGILYLKRNFNILSPALYSQEKYGGQPLYFPKKLPNALAILALNQLKKLERFNQHRKEIANIYTRELSRMKIQILTNNENDERIYMRYPIFTKNAQKIREKLKKQNIILDDGWHTSPVVPPDTNLQEMNYIQREYPRAEKIAQTILNLPTSINTSKNDAKKILNLLSKIVE